MIMGVKTRVGEGIGLFITIVSKVIFFFVDLTTFGSFLEFLFVGPFR